MVMSGWKYALAADDGKRVLQRTEESFSSEADSFWLHSSAKGRSSIVRGTHEWRWQNKFLSKKVKKESHTSAPTQSISTKRKEIETRKPFNLDIYLYARTARHILHKIAWMDGGMVGTSKGSRSALFYFWVRWTLDQ